VDSWGFEPLNDGEQANKLNDCDLSMQRRRPLEAPCLKKEKDFTAASLVTCASRFPRLCESGLFVPLQVFRAREM
jgi:hypothetical protein